MKIALRTYTDLNDNNPDAKTEKTNGNPGKIWVQNWSNLVCIFDTETTTDETQKMKFGAYRIYHQAEKNVYHLLSEGLFYDDRNITVAELKILQDYCDNRLQGSTSKNGG